MPSITQGVVTPISTISRAATGDCDPDVGVAYRITPFTTKKSRTHGGFLRRSQGYRQFSGTVTQSQAVFGRSQSVSSKYAHTGVTTPWSLVRRTYVSIAFQHILEALLVDHCVC